MPRNVTRKRASLWATPPVPDVPIATIVRDDSTSDVEPFSSDFNAPLRESSEADVLPRSDVDSEVVGGQLKEFDSMDELIADLDSDTED